MQPSKPGEHYGASHLVERQMLFHDALEKVVHPAARSAPSPRHTFLTISRQIGSFGNDVVQELGGHLCWHVYDREIMDDIAQNAHVRQRLVEQLDEKAQNLVHETVRRFLRMAEGGSFGSEEYHEGLLRTLAGLAAKGESILVGRGANFALHGQAGGLHLRIVASDEVRVERLRLRWNLPLSDCLHKMHEIDAEQSKFVRHHFKHEIEDSRFYDLILNTDRLSPQQAVSAILSAI